MALSLVSFPIHVFLFSLLNSCLNYEKLYSCSHQRMKIYLILCSLGIFSLSSSQFSFCASLSFLALNSLGAPDMNFFEWVCFSLNALVSSHLKLYLRSMLNLIDFQVEVLCLTEDCSSLSSLYTLQSQVENIKSQFFLKVGSKTPCTINIIIIFFSMLQNNLYWFHTKTKSHI